MEVAYHIKCMFPRSKLFDFKKVGDVCVAHRSSSHDTVDDIMRDTLSTLINSGIPHFNIKISSVIGAVKPVIFLTLLENVNIYSIARMLRLDIADNSRRSLSSFGERYFISSIDALRTLGA